MSRAVDRLESPAPDAPVSSVGHSDAEARGRRWLRFRCTCCGECCRSVRVPVTHFDVERLVRSTGEPASALVEWLAPEQVDMTGEPGSFVELAEGRRLMVLRHTASGCRFLDASNRCSVHADRPADCRLFPFDARVSSSGALRRLRLLPFDRCDFELDGHTDERSLVVDDRARWTALADYQARVSRFNRSMRTRKRLRKRLANALEFLAYLGLG